MNITEQIKKSLCHNYVGGGFYVHPNLSSGGSTDVKSADRLNKFSNFFRQSDFAKNFVKEEGFELNPVDFVWEWIIKFNNKSGFMAIKENGSKTILYVYDYENSLDPRIFVINDLKHSNFIKFLTLIIAQSKKIPK